MVTRHIYVYREKTTAKAVYVGSAFDVAGRDKTHQSGKLTFDHEIRKRGRDFFTIEIAETVVGADSADVYNKTIVAENAWMDKLHTFRTAHGFNFQRANALYRSEEHRQAVAAGARVAWSRPKEKARRVAALKAGNTWSDATNEKRRIASTRIVKEKIKKDPKAWAKQQANAVAAALSPSGLAAMKAGCALRRTPEWLSAAQVRMAHANAIRLSKRVGLSETPQQPVE